jgi:hypothetical protein
MPRKSYTRAALMNTPPAPPAPVKPSRIQQLVTLLSELTVEDMIEIDAEVMRVERQLAGLGMVRNMLSPAAVVSADKPVAKAKVKKNPVPLLAGPAEPAESDNGSVEPANGHQGDAGRADRITELRRKTALYLAEAGHACRSGDIIRNVPVGPTFITEVLDHPWFTQTPQGIYLSPSARQEVVDDG